MKPERLTDLIEIRDRVRHFYDAVTGGRTEDAAWGLRQMFFDLTGEEVPTYSGPRRTDPHDHCDRDPIECSVEALEGEYTETRRKLAELHEFIAVHIEGSR